MESSMLAPHGQGKTLESLLLLKASVLAYQAFEHMDLPGYQVVDSLKNMLYTKAQCKEVSCDQLWHGEGVFFASEEDKPSQDSIKMSFHVHIRESNHTLKFEYAYSYDTRTGNEVGFLGSLPE